MLPFKTLIVPDKNAATPVYQQVANRLVTLIQEGRLQPGSPLPSSREMALLLDLHRKTIIAAYEELYAQDWIETIPRKGVMISQHLPEIKPRSFYTASSPTGYGTNTGFALAGMPGTFSPLDTTGHRLIINDGFPDARIAPIDLLLKEYRQLFHRPAVQRKLMYGDQAGSPNLRNALVKFLSDTRGVTCTGSNILMTRGAQMAIYMTAHILIKPGATVVVADPNYPFADEIFLHCGAKLVRVPADDNGIDVDAIARICKKKKPDLLYIIPHHHHPTTVTLGADRRMKLLQLIRHYNLPVIEDDYDYDFHYSSSPILPLASADHGGNVIYIGSLTKTLAPFVRIGYMVAAKNFIHEATRMRRLVDIRGDDLLEEALGNLFNDGTMQRHLKKSVKLYHERRDIMCELLQKELDGIVSFEKPQGGMAVWARFQKKYPLATVAAKASQQGLYMSNGSVYNSGGQKSNALRMGFASFTKKEMEEAIGIIKKVVRGERGS